MATATHGGEVVASVLAREGVRSVFTLVGGHISPLLVAADAAGIRVVDVRDEATAAFAADATSRMGGAPGVAAVTAGPGVTNTITALENARLAQSPLVLLGGATATVLKGRGALQDIDQMTLVRPHVKWAAAVKRVRDLAPVVERAFAESRSGVPGPVFVECPVDLLYPEATVREWYFAGQRPPKSLQERAIHWYLQRHLDGVFRKGRGTPGTGLTEQTDPPAPADLRAVRAHLARAQRPVLVVSSQAVGTGVDVARLAATIDRLGLPVYLSGMARGLLGPNHPLQFRHKRKEALREADLVILAGTPNDFRLDYGRQVSRKATLVSINRDRDDLSKNRRPTVGAHAAPDEFLAALNDRSSTRQLEPWIATLRGREDARDREIAAQADAPVNGVNPIALCRAIDACLPNDSVIVADGGDFVATSAYVLRPRRPLSWLDPGVFGTLGVGAGFILGAHCARPGAELWAIYGDGALGFSLAEFDTFVRHRVPVIAVVGNDAKWAQIARDQVAVLGSDVATRLARTDYHKVVEGFGARGLLLDDPSKTAETLAEARRLSAEGFPVLVNALIGDTEFRKGSISL